MLFCTKCGFEMEDGDRFCMKCGSPVPAQPQEACRKCGTPLGEDFLFCKKCGTPVDAPADDEREIATDPVPAEEPAKEPEAAPVPVNEPEPAQETEKAPASSKSNIEKLEERAIAGDPTAMFLMGQYYDSLDNEVLIGDKRPHRIAMDWYEKAAEAGHVGGIAKTCYHRSTLSYLSELASDLTDPKVAQDELDLYRLFAKGVEQIKRNAPGTELLKDPAEFIKDAETARYRAASAAYYVRDDATVTELVHGREDAPSRLLDALLRYDKAQTAEELGDALKGMSFILDDCEYCSASKTIKEEGIFVMAAIDLAGFERKGLKNTDSAYGILTKIQSYLKTDLGKNFINSELAHYVQLPSGKVIYKEAT